MSANFTPGSWGYFQKRVRGRYGETGFQWVSSGRARGEITQIFIAERGRK